MTAKFMHVHFLATRRQKAALYRLPYGHLGGARLQDCGKINGITI